METALCFRLISYWKRLFIYEISGLDYYGHYKVCFFLLSYHFFLFRAGDTLSSIQLDVSVKQLQKKVNEGQAIEFITQLHQPYSGDISLEQFLNQAHLSSSHPDHETGRTLLSQTVFMLGYTSERFGWASQQNAFSLLKYLLDQGANPNQVAIEGESPSPLSLAVELAVRHGVFVLLLQHGALPTQSVYIYNERMHISIESYLQRSISRRREELNAEALDAEALDAEEYNHRLEAIQRLETVVPLFSKATCQQASG